MRIEDCLVSVERRSAGGCLDLGIVFTRRFFVLVYRLWLWFAIPACGLVYAAASVETDMLIPSGLIFMFFATWYSGALVATVGPLVFGVEMRSREALRGLRKRFFAFALLMFLYRVVQALLAFCLVVPGIVAAAYAAFIPEVLLLEKAGMNATMKRLGWLAGGGGFSTHLGRALMYSAFWATMSCGLFVVADLLLEALFNIVLVDLSELFEHPESFARLIQDDPLLLTVAHFCLWLPYPVVRMAWFFSYLDRRIRAECWDLDLAFRVEANRLEASP